MCRRKIFFTYRQIGYGSAAMRTTNFSASISLSVGLVAPLSLYSAVKHVHIAFYSTHALSSSSVMKTDTSLSSSTQDKLRDLNDLSSPLSLLGRLSLTMGYIKSGIRTLTGLKSTYV